MINFNKIPSYIRNEINPPKTVIKQGARSSTVQRIQEWLNYHQYHTVIDGMYGPATGACIGEFQERMQIETTGHVGQDTWNELVKPINRALKAPPGIERMTLAESVHAVALQHIEQQAKEIGGDNRGPWVRLYCKGNDGKQWAWCAGFVSFIIQQACFYRNTKTPIQGSVSCDMLAAQGETSNLFVSGRSILTNNFSWSDFGGCCIFLRRRTTGDWNHAGFATSSTGHHTGLVFSTIEGNTNDEGSREGFEACTRKRSIKYKNYDFIRLDRSIG